MSASETPHHPSHLPPTTALRALLLTLSFVAMPSAATGQEGVPQPPGLVPEQMWYAPTAEDWQKPVQIRWQRTWQDAVKLSQQTKKPILVCVNMDGEIASEHYAGVRYRDPEIAKLFEPYVCVIASVYRHNPRDYDEQGRRIPCPRLGCVTCGEHIAMEPIVFEKFLDGKRISPRHIMVELDGSETYDVFYTWDVKSVLDTLDDGIKNREIQAQPIVKGDRSLKERILSPDSEDREAIEREFAAADAEQKKRMLQLGLEGGDEVPLELLRQAASALDPELQAQARQGLQQTTDALAVPLIAQTLQTPLPQDDRKGLIESLERIGETSTHARTLATAHKGLDQGASVLDGKQWQSVLVGEAYRGANQQDVASEAARRDAVLAAKPDDPKARLDVAESSLLQALEVRADGGPGSQRLARQQRRLLLADAERNLERATTAGASGWRPTALRALLLVQQGRHRQAHELAFTAMPQMPPDAPGTLSKELLQLFAHGRQFAIRRAVQNREPWPGEWTSDVHTAYSLLLNHPFGTDRHVADHYDFLKFFGSPDTDEVLERGLEKFPASPLLHERLRARLLEKGGIDALRRFYEAALAADDAAPTMQWFAGYAELVIAEQHRRRQEPDAARESYGRALKHYRSWYDHSGEAVRHFEAMAHGGLARLALQQGDLQQTFAELQQVFTLAPAAAAATDGLDMTALQTAEMLRGRLLDTDDKQMLQQLEAAMQALPDEAYVLPEYEQKSRGVRMGRRPGERRR